MTNDEYFKLKALNASGIKTLLAQSPEHFKYQFDNPNEPTPAMVLGTVTHTAILEPDKLDASIAVIPNDAPDKRSKAGREWHATFAEQSQGRILVSEDDLARVKKMADRVRSHTIAGGLLEMELEFEQALVWRDPKYSVMCKCKPDALSKDRTFVLDVKTSDDASSEAFSRAAHRYGYHIQAAHYIEGVTCAENIMPSDFIFIVVESKPPHAVAVYKAEDRMIRLGQAKCDEALEIYRRCIHSNEWPSYPEHIQRLALPQYAYKQRDINVG